MTRSFLHSWNVSATFRISQKGSISQICVVPFSNLGNWVTFGPLRLRCLFYIWTTLLITVHTFAAVVISLHIEKYAILFHLAWLHRKNLGFTLFLVYSHKGWTANSSSSPLSTLTKMFSVTYGRTSVVKCGGAAWSETNIVIGPMQNWSFVNRLQIFNLVS